MFDVERVLRASIRRGNLSGRRWRVAGQFDVAKRAPFLVAWLDLLRIKKRMNIGSIAGYSKLYVDGYTPPYEIEDTEYPSHPYQP